MPFRCIKWNSIDIDIPTDSCPKWFFLISLKVWYVGVLLTWLPAITASLTTIDYRLHSKNNIVTSSNFIVISQLLKGWWYIFSSKPTSAPTLMSLLSFLQNRLWRVLWGFYRVLRWPKVAEHSSFTHILKKKTIWEKMTSFSFLSFSLSHVAVFCVIKLIFHHNWMTLSRSYFIIIVTRNRSR